MDENSKHINKKTFLDVDLDNIDLVNTNPDNYQNYNNKGQESNLIKEKIKNIKPYKFEENNYLKVFKISNNDEIINNLSSFSSKALYKSHQSFNKNLSFYNCVVDENAYFYKFFKDIVLKYIDFPNKDKLEPSRSYINLHRYGYPGAWHTDGPGLGPTILVYVNKIWDIKWQGQTGFCIDKTNNKVQNVDCIPGNIVVFNPNIYHRAFDVSADAMINNVERYTLAYHTYFSDN